jgi:PTS system mannose-specific IIA component
LVGIILVSHGEMGAAMRDAACMIVGPQPKVEAVSLRESDDVEGLMERVAAAVTAVDEGEGVLILVDVFGASPFNAAARLAMQRGKLEVLTGMSLPMFLELAVRRAGKSLEDLTAIARDAGISGVRTYSETLGKRRPS